MKVDGVATLNVVKFSDLSRVFIPSKFGYASSC